MIRVLVALLCCLILNVPALAAEALPGDTCSAVNNLQFTSGPEVAGGGGHALLCQGGTWKPILSFSSAAGLTMLGNQTCATNEILKFNGTTWACAADDAGSGGDNLGNHIATTVLRSDTHNTDDLGTTAIRWKDGWFAGTVTGGTFVGSGASLTSLNASNLASGTVPAARLPAYTGDVTKAAGGTALTITANAVTTTEILDNTIAASDIAPNAVTASELANDAVTIPKLAATGTASASTFLRGDNAWAAPPAGGGISAVTTATCTASCSGLGCTGSCVVNCPVGYFRTGCSSSDNGADVSGAGCGCTAVNGNPNSCRIYCAK